MAVLNAESIRALARSESDSSCVRWASMTALVSVNRSTRLCRVSMRITVHSIFLFFLSDLLYPRISSHF